MSGAETRLYTGVHEKLPKEVYREKMYNPLRGGTPDCYYERRRKLWIEYKFVALPARDSTVIKFNVSDLQTEWLKRCYDNGHAPRVIVGTKVGRTTMGALLETPREWENGMPCGDFKRLLMSQQSLADAITRIVS